MIANQKLDREAFNDIFELIKKRSWVNDLQEELMNLWELCESEVQRALLKELILEIYVLDNQSEKLACKAINTQFMEWGLQAERTFIVGVADVGKSDGSSVGIQQLKLKIKPTDEWGNRYITHIPEAVGKVKDGDSIIIFDDFIGSGEKMIKKYRWLCDVLSDDLVGIDCLSLNFYFVAFSGMKFGLKNLSDTLKKPIFTYKSLDKGISENNNDMESKAKIEEMLSLETKLNEKYQNRLIGDYSLGYNKSESLYYWENYSCPNNVFPIFWWPKLKDDKTHNTLFERVN